MKVKPYAAVILIGWFVVSCILAYFIGHGSGCCDERKLWQDETVRLGYAEEYIVNHEIQWRWKLIDDEDSTKARDY